MNGITGSLLSFYVETSQEKSHLYKHNETLQKKRLTYKHTKYIL